MFREYSTNIYLPGGKSPKTYISTQANIIHKCIIYIVKEIQKYLLTIKHLKMRWIITFYNMAMDINSSTLNYKFKEWSTILIHFLEMVFTNVIFLFSLHYSFLFLYFAFVLSLYIFISYLTITISTVNVHSSNFLFNAHCSFVFGCCLLLSIHCSLLSDRHSLLSAPCSLLFIVPLYVFLALHYFLDIA